jgi:Ca2+:H+ antiporter
LINGNADVVKGQITGSIIGNSLLGLGLAILIGSFGRSHQTFNRERSGLLSSLLILVMIGLLLPALFDFTERGLASSPNTGSLDEYLSLGVSTVLISLYFANLVYTFITHRDIFSGSMREAEPASWSLWLAVMILIFATILTALEAELVSNALDSTATQLGISTFFLGVVVLALIGNASEYVSAMYFARQNQMSLAMSITVGSTIQIGLLVAPVLVVVSFMIGHPMNLVFANPIEMIAIAVVAFVVNAISQDGQVTWFEGAMLLGVYIMLGIAFFFVTPPL